MTVTNPRLARIAKVSRIIATVCGILLVLFPVLIGSLTFFWQEFLAIQHAARQMGVKADEISFLARLASLGAMLVGSAPLLWGLWILRQLFLEYAAGAVFTQSAADLLKRVAYALLALIIARPVGGALFSLALSIDTVKAPGGQGHLAIMVGSTEVWLGLAGSMVLVIAWIMGEAAKLADENKSFV
jgi:signal transduction histidine kinase